MADRLRDKPIKQKLLIVMAVVTATALLVAGVTIFFWDTLLFERRLQNDMTALAQITADDTTAAISFEDPQAAAEALMALKHRQHLLSACIYRADGSLLASFIREGSSARCIPADAKPQNSPLSGNLTLSRPVILNGKVIGTLTMLYERAEIFERMRLYGTIICIVLIGSSGFSFLISSRLRNLIAQPIEELARASSAVSSTRDYSVRAKKVSADELGMLVDTFNQMLSDIQSRDTELRSTLAELQGLNESLARSNADLERFAFVASHDLQEPLRMMSVFSQLLAREYRAKLDNQAGDYIAHIVGGARRMRELLSDLLEYTYLSSNPNFPAGSIDLNVMLEQVKENLAAAISASQAVVTSDPLPKIAAYEAHFVPLFQNLISNAIKYRSEARPHVHIRLRETVDDFQFEFTDNGIGIPPEYQKRIFLPFQRLHGKEIPGTGIGLAICLRIIERYGGKIWVESQTGRGSAFIFTLPKDAAVEGQSEDGRAGQP